MELTEKQQLEALRAGDETVFEMIFRSYYQVLCNYANSFLHEREEAEEIVQSSFLGVWERRATFHITTSLKSYLFGMVRNASLNRLKHVKVRQKHAGEELLKPDRSLDQASHPMLVSELQNQINDALQSLPEQCRLIFKMNRFEEMKYAEIAAQLNISVKTVENQIGKALRIIREKLSDYLPLTLMIIYFGMCR